MKEEQKIDRRVFDLYDEYCHGRMDRREFLSRAAAMTIGGVSALWMAQALLPRYAEAQMISFTDPRMMGTYVDYQSPGGVRASVGADPHPFAVGLPVQHGLPFIDLGPGFFGGSDVVHYALLGKEEAAVGLVD